MRTSEESGSDSDNNISKKELLKRLNKLEKKLHKGKRRHRDRDHSGERRPRSQNSNPTRPKRGRTSTPRPSEYSCPRTPRSERRSLNKQDYRNRRGAESRNASADRISEDSASALSIEDHDARHLASNIETVATAANTGEGNHSPNNSNLNTIDGAAVLQIHNDEVLPDDILQILGDDPRKSEQASFEIHAALSSRWGYVLTNGLLQAEKGKLFDRYTLPSNCEALTPPLLNPEVVNILSQPHLKRDKSLSDQQYQLSMGVTALAKGLQIILDEKENLPKAFKDKVVECLGDSGRLLSDLSHSISMVRRMLIVPSLSKSVKETVEKTKPLTFLFGTELGERVKEAKIMEKASKDLKVQQAQALPSSSKAAQPAYKKTNKGRGGSALPITPKLNL